MSDLLAPILYVLDNEVDAFWCFAAYMDRVVQSITINIKTFGMILSSYEYDV